LGLGWGLGVLAQVGFAHPNPNPNANPDAHPDANGDPN